MPGGVCKILKITQFIEIKPQISLPDGAIIMNSLSIYKTIFAGGLAQGENAICNPGGRGAASPPVILYLNRAI